MPGAHPTFLRTMNYSGREQSRSNETAVVMIEGFFKALEDSLVVLSILSRNIVESVDLRQTIEKKT
jgi:hypothetical protein